MEKAIKQAIQSGRLVLGLELGSTRIKAELLTDQLTPVATGAYYSASGRTRQRSRRCRSQK